MLNNLKGIDLVLFNLEKEIEHIKDVMSDGSLSSYEEYKAHCGEVRGLLKAKREILTVFGALDDD